MPHSLHFHRLIAGFALAAIAVVSPALMANTASAAPADLDACAQQGGVYVVVTQDGPTMGVCVSNPSTGTDALKAAGVTITRDATGMICALNNYPNPCPATFDGKYWQYYQASAADAEAGNWAYATTGSDDTHPQSGWVEGWCYGAQCAPVLPADAATPPTSSETPTPAATANGPGATIAVAAIIIVILVFGAIVLVRQRRR